MSKRELMTIIKCCGCFVCYGLINNCFGIFFFPIYQETNLSMASISATITIRGLGSAFFVSLFLPKLMRKIDIKYVLSAGVLLTTLAYVMLAKTSNLYVMYLASLILGIGISMYANFPMSVIINNWFEKKNGTVIGITMAAAGVSGAIMSPICSSIIKTYGYRNGYLFTALMLMVFGLPCAYTLEISPVKRSKEELAQKRKSSLKVSKLSLLGMVLLSYICVAKTSFLGIANLLSSLGVSYGHDLLISSYLVSAAMIGNILSKIAIGVLSDKTDPYYSCCIAFAITLAGLFGIRLFGSNILIAMVSSFLFGFSYGAGTTGVPLLTRAMFGNRGYSAAYPLIDLISLLASSVFTILVGGLYDIFGTYDVQIALAIVMGGIGTILLWLLHRKTFAFQHEERFSNVTENTNKPLNAEKT